MKTKFTPGPWVADGSDMSLVTWAYGPDKRRVCTMSRGPKDWDNTRLIAAAPELYAALVAIVDQEQHDSQPETHMHDMADIARAALANVGA